MKNVCNLDNVMIEGKIKILKKIVKGKKVNCFSKGDVKYIGLNAKYNAIMAELGTYSIDEIKFLKMIIQNKKARGEEMREWLGMIPLFLTSLGLMYSLLIPILVKVNETNLVCLIQERGNYIALLPGVVALLAYMIINIMSSTMINTNQYLLGYIDIYLELQNRNEIEQAKINF